MTSSAPLAVAMEIECLMSLAAPGSSLIGLVWSPESSARSLGSISTTGMLSIARRNPQIDWHQGSATDLPFEPSSFEVVLCQQGLQFFPDRVAAISEMARVLAPGGRLAVNVWGALERQPFHAAVISAIGMFLGAETKAAFDMAFSLNTADELRSLARDAGNRGFISVSADVPTRRSPDGVVDVAIELVQLRLQRIQRGIQRALNTGIASLLQPIALHGDISTTWRRRPTRSARLRLSASASGRSSGRTHSANRAMTSASSASVLASRPWRGRTRGSAGG